MYSWENIQTKTEADFIFEILKKEIKDTKIKRIFSFNYACPEINKNTTYSFTDLDEELFIQFENNYALVISFYNYSELFIEYRLLRDSEQKWSITNNKPADYLNSHHEIHRHVEDKNPYQIIDITCNYSSINDIKVHGFKNEYDKWISTGNSCTMIKIPAGGDYFDSINFILSNKLEIKITPEPAEFDGYYNIDIIDKNRNITYKEYNV